jgi:hypothetical protein
MMRQRFTLRALHCATAGVTMRQRFTLRALRCAIAGDRPSV